MNKKIILTLLTLATTGLHLHATTDNQGASSIKVNQVGYYPTQEKVAVIEPQIKQKTFSLKDSKGKTVWSGKASRISVSPFDGRKRQVVDFSKLTKPGTYTFVAGNQKQQVIIRPNALKDIATAAMKSYYYQRTGMAIEAQYAGKWTRPAAHMDDKVLVHPSAASPGRPAGTVISSPYGWYDAGDFNKYIVNSGFTIGMMLTAYQLDKPYFDAMDLNIPEKGSECPQFLEEIMYNLKWMLTMQDPFDGGVYHKLTTPHFEDFIMPAQCKQTRYVVQKSTPATLDFAATMAQAARIYKPYQKYQQFCEEALRSAERAYAWAVRNPTVMYRQDVMNKQYKPEVSTGTYGDGDATDEFFWAATELYKSTGQSAYLEQARQFVPAKYSTPTWGSLAWLGCLEWLNDKILNPAMTLEARHDAPDISFTYQFVDQIIAFANECVDIAKTSPFNTCMGTKASDFCWGSNSEMCAGRAISLIYAYRMTGEQKYLTAAIQNVDYLLGRNATGYCFVTGFGTKPVMHPHQRISSADGIEDPMPGFLAGGPNMGKQDRANVSSYTSDIPDECYTDDQPSYASNEIAINWNAYLVALLGMVDSQVK